MMSQKAPSAWSSDSVYREGMLSVLQLAVDKYFAGRYYFLAEHATHYLLAIHRTHGEFEMMRKVYQKQENLLSNSLAFSTGNYFRVLYLGTGYKLCIVKE